MGFILDGLETEDYDRIYGDKTLLLRIMSYFRPYSRQTALTAAAMALNAVMGIGAPILISRAIDIVSVRPSIRGILLFSTGVLLLGVSAWIFSYIKMLFSARVTGNVVLNMRRDVFDALMNHDLSFFHDHPSGKIVSRVTSDTHDFSEVVRLTVDLMGQCMVVGILVIWLFMIDVRLTLLTLAMIPFATLMALGFRKVARTVTQQARRITAVINAEIQESVSGISVAKSFRKEDAIYRSFRVNNDQAYRYGIRRGLVLSSIFPVISSASSIGLALLVFVGGLTVKSGRLSPGDWYLFMQSVAYIWWPMLNISSFWSQFQDGLSAAERVFALMDAESEIVQTGADEPLALEGRIEFDQVDFRYTDNETVLSGFSLRIAPRETLALVGHTGAGKSSIVKLIARFYEFGSGSLLIDGKDIRALDLKHYRRQIGIVPQEPFLFSGSAADNIRFGNPDASDDEIRTAATRIGGGEWISSLSDRLKTDVGERGANLSMGQRQLVALARVLLKNPAIFILDEATASVDPFTEVQIKEGLETVMQDRTAIVIAHRLSTVRTADRIIVLDNGRIVEQGDHDSLMAGSGRYHELYHTYFRHQDVGYVERGNLKSEI